MKDFLRRYGTAYAAGTILFREGEYGDRVFIIHSGKVKIVKKVRAADKTLAILGKGDFFGEMAVLDSKPRSATAEVLEDSIILVLDDRTFEKFLLANSAASLQLIKKLVHRLRDADDQIETLMIKDVESKVVNTLIKIVPDIGVSTAEGIRLPLKGEDLLVKVGLSKKELTQVLSNLKVFGLIKISGGRILIPSLNKLNKFSRFLAMKEEFANPVPA